MISPPLKLGFLASGNGSSFRAIVNAIEARGLAAEPRLLVSNRRDAPALAFAAERDVPVAVIPTTNDPQAADARLRDALQAAGAELVILSGYLRKLGPLTLAAYEHRILNIHPALLPKFGGPGMYGRRVHDAVAAAGDRISGMTVHLVDGEYDHGAVVAAREIALAAGDDAGAIEAKVTAAEPGFFVEVLLGIAEGSIRLPGTPSAISDNLP